MALLSERGRDVVAVDAPSRRLASAPACPDGEVTVAAFHQVHLPVLEAAGLVEYDGRSGAVRYLAPPVVPELLDAVPTEAPASD